MGSGVHSSIKTFYFGLLCTLCTLGYLAVMNPEFYHVWKIGTPEYPLGVDQLLASLVVGFFSWANQESLSLSLTIVKQGTASAFNNVALVVSFMTDAFYFGRTVLPTDIVGTSMIIFFSVLMCLSSNTSAKQEKQQVRKDLMTKDPKSSKVLIELEKQQIGYIEEQNEEADSCSFTSSVLEK